MYMGNIIAFVFDDAVPNNYVKSWKCLLHSTLISQLPFNFTSATVGRGHYALLGRCTTAEMRSKKSWIALGVLFPLMVILVRRHEGHVVEQYRVSRVESHTRAHTISLYKVSMGTTLGDICTLSLAPVMMGCCAGG